MSKEARTVYDEFRLGIASLREDIERGRSSDVFRHAFWVVQKPCLVLDICSERQDMPGIQRFPVRG